MAEVGLILSVHFGLKLFQSIRKFFTDTLELDKYNFYVKSNIAKSLFALYRTCSIDKADIAFCGWIDSRKALVFFCYFDCCL